MEVIINETLEVVNDRENGLILNDIGEMLNVGMLQYKLMLQLHKKKLFARQMQDGVIVFVRVFVRVVYVL